MNTTVENILNVFQNYRMRPTPNDQYEEKGKDVLRNKIAAYVAKHTAIDFVMLGFPFKSTNIRDKVIGILPDLGEELTLKNFAKFNEDIKTVYNAGVQLHVVSDGFIFNDVLNVEDKIVYGYKEVSVDMGKNSPVSWYDLNDFYSGDNLVSKREKVVDQFGITEEKLQQEILFNPDFNYLYNGMIRFMEEELAMNTYPSRNQLHKAAKKLTREMMFRNEAYSNLVREEFSSMVRLSMHPSVNNGAKYSFQLIPSPKAYHSAWHCAIAVGESGELETVHRKDAEQAGYELVYQSGRPYYFSIKN